MKRFLEVCAGIDAGKREIAVSIVSGTAQEEPTCLTKSFGTTVPALQECLKWLLENNCPTVVIESTGSYWIPIWNVMTEAVAVIVVNAEHVKARRGEKTDPADSRRLAERLRVGDIRGSYVPKASIMELRDLTRRRKKVLGQSNSERNRIQKLLEQGNVKIGNIVSDVFGVSGQQILKTLLNNLSATPEQMAALAKGKLRNKQAAIEEALRGHRLDEHLRWMISHCLSNLVFLEGQLRELDERIQQKLKPFEREYSLLQTIPGVGPETAAVIIAETGGNMAQFPTERNLTSWAGVCPGNNRSAGKQKNGRIKKANRWLLAALVQAGWGAVRKKGSIFKKRFYRQAQHRGRCKAVIATARALLEVVWHVLSRMTPYREAPNEEMEKREHSKKVLHHLRKLRQLGITIDGIEIPEPSKREAALPPVVQTTKLGALGIHAR